MIRVSSMNEASNVSTVAKVDADQPGFCLPTNSSKLSLRSLPMMSTSPSSPLEQREEKRSYCSTGVATKDGYLRFPCRARGFDNDTDHFEIGSSGILVPPRAEHGLLLRCSNAACITSGRVFRWCTVCKKVAAKRNFWQRHGHSFTKKRMPKYYQRKKWLPEKAQDTVMPSRPEMIRKMSQEVLASILQAKPKPLKPVVATSVARYEKQRSPFLGKRCPDTTLSTSAKDGIAPLSPVGNDPGEWNDGELERIFDDV